MSKWQFPGLVIVAAAAALCACASTGSSPRPAAGGAKPAVSGKNYKAVVRNGETYYCRREAVTGSRTEVIETCLTQAQLDAENERTRDLVRRIGSTPDAGRAVDPSGGTSNGAMGN